jgi:hypothetical protein
VNYTSHFSITDPSESIDACAEALQSEASYTYGFPFVATSATPAYLCTVHSFVETNLYARYAVDQHLAVHGSITNVFNKQAPIDAQTYGGGLLAYDGVFEQDGAIGRFFLVGATYKFQSIVATRMCVRATRGRRMSCRCEAPRRRRSSRLDIRDTRKSPLAGALKSASMMGIGVTL